MILINEQGKSGISTGDDLPSKPFLKDENTNSPFSMADQFQTQEPKSTLAEIEPIESEPDEVTKSRILDQDNFNSLVKQKIRKPELVEGIDQFEEPDRPLFLASSIVKNYSEVNPSFIRNPNILSDEDRMDEINEVSLNEFKRTVETPEEFISLWQDKYDKEDKFRSNHESIFTKTREATIKSLASKSGGATWEEVSSSISKEDLEENQLSYYSTFSKSRIAQEKALASSLPYLQEVFEMRQSDEIKGQKISLWDIVTFGGIDGEVIANDTESVVSKLENAYMSLDEEGRENLVSATQTLMQIMPEENRTDLLDRFGNAAGDFATEIIGGASKTVARGVMGVTGVASLEDFDKELVFQRDMTDAMKSSIETKRSDGGDIGQVEEWAGSIAGSVAHGLLYSNPITATYGALSYMERARTDLFDLGRNSGLSDDDALTFAGKYQAGLGSLYILESGVTNKILFGKFPVMDKALSRISASVGNIYLRGAGRVVSNTAIETTSEVLSNIAPQVVQSVASAVEESGGSQLWAAQGGNDWLGEDGIISDALSKENLSQILSVTLPLSLFGAFGGFSDKKRSLAFAKKLTLEQWESIGGNEKTFKKFNESANSSDPKEQAKTQKHLEEGFLNLEPKSERSEQVRKDLAEAMTKAAEEASVSKVFPKLVVSKETGKIEVVSPETNEVVAVANSPEEATKLAYEFMGIEAEKKDAEYDVLLSLLEAGASLSKEAKDANATFEIDLSKEVNSTNAREQALEDSKSEVEAIAKAGYTRLKSLDESVARLKELDKLSGGNGNIPTQVIYGENVETETSITRKIYSGANIMDLVHEDGHAARDNLIKSGDFNETRFNELLVKLNNAVKGKKTRRTGETIEFFVGESPTAKESSEAFAELTEMEVLNTRKGKKTGIRDIVRRFFAAEARMGDVEARNFMSYIRSMKEKYGRVFTRKTIIDKAVRDGKISKKEIDDLRAMLQGTKVEEEQAKETKKTVKKAKKKAIKELVVEIIGDTPIESVSKEEIVEIVSSITHEPVKEEDKDELASEESIGEEDLAFGVLPTAEAETALSRKIKEDKELEAQEEIEAPKRRMAAIKKYISEGSKVKKIITVTGRKPAMQGGGDIKTESWILLHPDKSWIPLSKKEASEINQSSKPVFTKKEVQEAVSEVMEEAKAEKPNPTKKKPISNKTAFEDTYKIVEAEINSMPTKGALAYKKADLARALKKAKDINQLNDIYYAIVGESSVDFSMGAPRDYRDDITRLSPSLKITSVADVVKAVREGNTDTPLRVINEVVADSKVLRDRVKAESEKRKHPRKRGAASILERISRERSAGTLNSEAAKALTSFVNSLNERFLDGQALSISKKGSGGVYDFADNLITLFNSKEGIESHTGVHEFWHSLSKYLPKAEVDKMEADYKQELAEYIKKNPGFLALVGRYGMTQEEYEAYSFFASPEDLKQLTKLQSTNSEGHAYAINFTKENYRYVMLDEYMAERMADLTMDKQKPKSDTVFGRLAEIFQEFLAMIQTKLGKNPYEKFYNEVMSPSSMRLKQRDTPLKAPEQIFNPSKRLIDKTRNIYIGESSIDKMPEERKQFMRDSLDTAKEMAAAGKSSKKIRAITGWFPGKYDGKMRWEIPDEGATWLTPPATYSRYGAMLGEILQHDALFAAYPELRKTYVTERDDMPDAEGAYVDQSGRDIILNATKGSEEKLSNLLHEIQHLIQRYEGFAKGSSPDSFFFTSKVDLPEEIQSEIDKLADSLKPLQEKRDALVLVLESTPQENRRGKEFQDKADQFRSLDDQIYRITSKQNKLRKDFEASAAFDAYIRTAGEIEARDVQARRNFTAAQRAAIEPYSSENIAPEDAIVMFFGKANESFQPESSVDFSMGSRRTYHADIVKALFDKIKTKEESPYANFMWMKTMADKLGKHKRDTDEVFTAFGKKYTRKALDKEDGFEMSQEQQIRRSYDLFQAMLDSLPVEVRTYVNFNVAALSKKSTNNQRKEYLLEKMDKAEDAFNKYRIAEYRRNIKKTMRAAKPDSKIGRAKGKITPEVHALFDRVEKYMGTTLSDEQVESRLNEFDEQIDKILSKGRTPENLKKIVEINEEKDLFFRFVNYSDKLINRASPDANARLASELEESAMFLEEARLLGRNRHKTLMEIREAEINRAVMIARAANPEAESEEILAASRKARTTKEELKSFFYGLEDLENLFVEFFGEELASNYIPRFREATVAVKSSLRKREKAYRDVIEQATGLKGTKLDYYIYDMRTNPTHTFTIKPIDTISESINIETFISSPDPAKAFGFSPEEVSEINGLIEEELNNPDSNRSEIEFERKIEKEAKEVKLTTSVLIERIMTWKQENYKFNLAKYGYGESFQEQAEKALDKVKGARESMEFMRQEYDASYDKGNEVYRQVNQINLPKWDNYAGTLINYGSNKELEVGGTFNLNGNPYDVTKKRINHEWEIIPTDAFELFIDKTTQMDHYAAYAEVFGEINAITGDVEVKKQMSLNPSLAKRLKEYLDDIQRDNSNSWSSPIIDRLLKNRSILYLSYNLPTIAKSTIGSYMNTYLGDVGLADSIRYQKKIFQNEGEIFKKMLYSDEIQNKFHSGSMPEVEFLFNKLKEEKPSQYRNFLMEGMRLIGSGDAYGSTINAAVHYAYHYDSYLEANKDKTEEAEKFAAYKALEQLGRTSQPLHKMDVGATKLRGGSLWNMLTAFTSEPIKKAIIYKNAWGIILKGVKTDKKSLLTNPKTQKAIRQIVAFHAIGLVMEVIGSAWKDSINDDDDEVFDSENWNISSIALSSFIGNLRVLPIFGDILTQWPKDSGVLKEQKKAMMAMYNMMKIAFTAEELEDGEFWELVLDATRIHYSVGVPARIVEQSVRLIGNLAEIVIPE